MHLRDSDVAIYHRDGYLIAPNIVPLITLLNVLRIEMEMVGRLFIPGFTLAAAPDQIRSLAPTARHCLYNAMRTLPRFHALASSELLVGISRQLGLRLPAMMPSAQNIRMDLPSEDQRLFDWHQDATYQLGSANAVTYWLPLGRVDRLHGSVTVIPGSHAQGIAPVRYNPGGLPPKDKKLRYSDIEVIEKPNGEGPVIEADGGDLVVFSQLAMHASTPNRSDQIRWTAIIRHTDLANPAFIEAGYPLGDTTNLFHTSYLPGFTPTPSP